MELITLNNFPFPDCTAFGEITENTQIEALKGTDPTKNFRLSEDSDDGIHAGIGMFTLFMAQPNRIPKEWISYGRTIIFNNMKMTHNVTGRRYVAALWYINGLVYDSRELHATWIMRKVMLDEDGNPIMHFGKEDLSCFYRYLVLRV